MQEPGSGITGIVGTQRVTVGTPEWLAANGATPAHGDSLRDATPAPGVTRVFVAVDGATCGHIDLVDSIRPGAREALAALRERGMRTIMLTGDAPAAAVAVGKTLGLPEEDVFAGVRPEGKLGKVEELREGGAQVAMVGDGINDASALAAADVGIAMGGGVQVRIGHEHGCDTELYERYPR